MCARRLHSTLVHASNITSYQSICFSARMTVPTSLAACSSCRCIMGLHYWGDRKADAALQMALAVGRSSLLPALAANLLTLQSDLRVSLAVQSGHIMVVRCKYSLYSSACLAHGQYLPHLLMTAHRGHCTACCK